MHYERVKGVEVFHTDELENNSSNYATDNGSHSICNSLLVRFRDILTFYRLKLKIFMICPMLIRLLRASSLGRTSNTY